MDAVFLGSRPNRSVISFARGPVVMMAMVLFAVHTFTSETSAAMVKPATLLQEMRFVRLPMI